MSFAEVATPGRGEQIAFGGKRYHSSATGSSYRSDIDGLRAISVIAVILFHAFPPLLKGGFIGVDVFFVISGFLITRLIVDGLERNNFTFADFYARRIRRIFPALLIVLATTFAIGWVILLPQEFRQMSKHLVGAAGFLLNFMLWREAGYFDLAAEAKPLLHLWSLAVEEQFYAVWPAVLWFVWRRKVNLFWMTMAIGAASFLTNIAIVYSDGPAAFFLPFTRFWELMIGCGLAVADPKYQRRILETVSPTAMGWVGLMLIVVAAIFLRGNAYPGVKALFPTIGAALIILSGPGAQLNDRLLSNRFLVSIGKISYPLYLWHWPLLSFAAIAYGTSPPLAARAALVGLSVVLSTLTYVLFERPVRFGRLRRRILPGLVVAMLIMGCIGGTTIANGGFPQRPVAQANKTLEADLIWPLETRTSDRSCPELLGIEVLKGEVCLTNSSRPEFLIIGDSHAMAFNSAVRAGRSNLKTVLLSTHWHLWNSDECSAPREPGDLPPQNSLCGSILQQAFRLAARSEALNTVVFAFYFDDPFFRNWALRVQQEFLKLGKRVVYIADVPEFETQPQTCVKRMIGLISIFVLAPEKGAICGEDLSSVVAKQADAKYPQFLASLKAADQRVQFFDGLRVFCDDRRCSQGDDDGALFFIGRGTGGHVNIRGSKRMLAEFEDWYRKRFAH